MNIRKNLNEIIIMLLLIIGLFFPSSNSYNIDKKNIIIMLFILLSFIIILLIKNGIQMSGIKFTMSILTINLFFTLLGMIKYSTTDINTGVLLQLFVFSLLLIIDYSKLKTGKNIIYLFNLVNIINIVLGFLIVFSNFYVRDFLMENYSAFYPDLIINMVMKNKPVLYFGSHSIAGFFIYLFFYMNILLYRKNKSKLNLVFSFLNIFLLLNIKSVTSIIFLVVAIIQLFYYCYKSSKKIFYIIFPLIIYIIIRNYSYLAILINKIFSSSINGFAGRYSNTGVLQQNFEYLKNNLLPIGIVNIGQIYYTDNGFVLNFIAGSVFLVIAIYGGLYFLFSNNIKNKKTSLWLFCILFAFEWAFPILYYERTLFFIPFLITFVRYVEDI